MERFLEWLTEHERLLLALPLFFVLILGYAFVRVAEARRPRRTMGHTCCRCGKDHHDDGTRVTWVCAGCQNFVCADCTLTMPDTKPPEYYALTLCSRRCWQAMGEPEE